jgi:hypothetical protein
MSREKAGGKGTLFSVQNNAAVTVKGGLGKAREKGRLISVQEDAAPRTCFEVCAGNGRLCWSRSFAYVRP